MAFEYNDDDFPFYNGKPVNLSRGQWRLILAVQIVSFLFLIAPIPFFAGGLLQLIPATVFFAMPLATLAYFAPAHWTSLFRPLSWRDAGWALAFGVLNIVVSITVGVIVLSLFGAEPSVVVDMLAAMSGADIAFFYLRTLPQLFGEELFTILFLLAVMTYCTQTLHFSRRRSLILGCLFSAVLFGVVHLPAYNWNLLQCLLIIGTARIVLLLAYIKTKNIWVSTGSHVFSDWVYFTVILSVTATMPA